MFYLMVLCCLNVGLSAELVMVIKAMKTIEFSITVSNVSSFEAVS